jgi:hypothetical protein
MNAPSRPEEDPPHLGTIAFEAEQQCARVQAIVHELAAAAPDAASGKYLWEAVECLLAPVLANLSTLAWELYAPAPSVTPEQPKESKA